MSEIVANIHADGLNATHAKNQSAANDETEAERP